MSGTTGEATATIKEAALRLGVSKNVAYAAAQRWLETGGRTGLPVLRLGSRLVVPTVALDRMLATGLIPRDEVAP